MGGFEDARAFVDGFFAALSTQVTQSAATYICADATKR